MHCRNSRPVAFSVLLVLTVIGLPLGSLKAQQGGSSEDTGASSSGNVATHYPLAPFDMVSVTVYGQPDLSVTQRISDAGAISMPLIGEFRIAGLTVSEAKKKIAREFIEQEYLRDPLVIINLESYTTNEITLIGEVGDQGEIELPVGVSQIEIQRLIAMAGGFTGIAKQDSVRVERRVPGSSEREVITVDVDRILNAKENEVKDLQFMVKAGDIVVVPRRIF